jgi:hypothetical protein
MEKVIRKVKTNTGETIFNRTRQCLLYADDALVLGRVVKHIGDSVVSQFRYSINASVI